MCHHHEISQLEALRENEETEEVEEEAEPKPAVADD
jgi:hypothetical protein